MKAQRGVALITVLLVVAVVTVVCASMIARQQLSIRATSNQLQARQAWHYALGGEALAQSILRRDLRATHESGAAQAPVDHLFEPWALPQPAFEIEQGRIQIRIEDLAGRFNLNSLVQNQQPNAAAQVQFRRLLLRLDITEPYAERLGGWLPPRPPPRRTGSTPTSSPAASRAPRTMPICCSTRRTAPPAGAWATCPNCVYCWTCARRIFSAWRPTSAPCRRMCR